MTKTQKVLANLYRATTFRVESPDGIIDIRVGEKHPRIDALLSHHKVTEWAYITAWNPRSQLLSAEQNALAQVQLTDVVLERGLGFYGGSGIPDNPGWTAERSVWIAGISRQAAVELGARFGQNAIVVGTAGGVAELLCCPE
jgi:hypothetical protein